MSPIPQQFWIGIAFLLFNNVLGSWNIGKFSGAQMTRCTVNPAWFLALSLVFCLIACGGNVVEIDIDFASALGRVGMCLGDEIIPFPWRVLSVFLCAFPSGGAGCME